MIQKTRFIPDLNKKKIKYRVLVNGEIPERETNKNVGYIIQPWQLQDALRLRGTALDNFITGFLNNQ